MERQDELVKRRLHAQRCAKAKSFATVTALASHKGKWPKPEMWDPKKSKKKKIAKIKIGSAQNVGKVWISRKQILLAPFGPIWAHFLRGPEKCQKIQNFAYFPWWANGPYSRFPVTVNCMRTACM